MTKYSKYYVFSILISILLVLGCKNITQTNPTSDTSTDNNTIFNITSMRRDTTTNVIEVRIDTFPSTWGNWQMYLNGKEVSMEGNAGEIVVRPNADLLPGNWTRRMSVIAF